MKTSLQILQPSILYLSSYSRILMYLKRRNTNDDQVEEWLSGSPSANAMRIVIFANDRRDNHVLLMKVIIILQE